MIQYNMTVIVRLHAPYSEWATKWLCSYAAMNGKMA